MPRRPNPLSSNPLLRRGEIPKHHIFVAAKRVKPNLGDMVVSTEKGRSKNFERFGIVHKVGERRKPYYYDMLVSHERRPNSKIFVRVAQPYVHTPYQVRAAAILPEYIGRKSRKPFSAK